MAFQSLIACALDSLVRSHRGHCVLVRRPWALPGAVRFVLVVLLAGTFIGGPGMARDAKGQVIPSDYMAYPKNMTLLDYMRRTDQVRLDMARWPGLSADYELGPGDEIKIRVFGVSIMDQSAKVTKAGAISLPLIGDVTAAGLTAEELETELASKLRDGGLVQDPQVLVYITAYESKQVYVFGAVDRPGLYQMTQQLRLMDAIFMAGGIDPNAGRFGYLHRKVAELGPDWPALSPVPVAAAVDPRSGNVRMAAPRDVESLPAVRELIDHPEKAFPGTEVLKFELDQARMGGILEPNLPLRPGDIVVISEMTDDFFYVIGDVRQPSQIQIPVPSYRKILVSQAIAWAGGPTKTARPSEGVLIRIRDGKREQIPVDFLAILEGRQPDMEIRANDVIFIPGSTAKTLAYGIMNTLPQTALMNATIR